MLEKMIDVTDITSVMDIVIKQIDINNSNNVHPFFMFVILC